MADPGGGSTLASSTSPSTSSENTLVPNQLAQLVPTFDPAKDDVLVYGQKVQLLLAAWPSGKYTELGTRLILGCSGSAFLKLQLHRSEVTGNDVKSIQRLVEILGGTWGQINLEKRYEYAERALYKCSQKTDESADSYLARADIMWSELRARDIKLEDLEPYVTLRGSQLSSDDKKRVLMEVDAANSGKLTISKVAASIRMLGASFFHDMTGQRRVRGKTYDQSALVADHQELEDHQPTMAMDYTDEIPEDEVMDTLLQEGDEDATLVADFEGTAVDVVQSDPELASALTAYTEARRRLSEKFRSRGFWPPSHAGKSKSKGGHRSPKGKFGKHGSQRKSLQQRIMESRCRICNQYGHWKAECPQRGNAATGSDRASTAPTSFVQSVSTSMEPSSLPLEFLQLPEHASTMDEPRVAPCLVCSFGFDFVNSQENQISKNRDRDTSIYRRLRESLGRWNNQFQSPPHPKVLRSEKIPDRSWNPSHSEANRPTMKEQPVADLSSETAETCFATHGSLGVVDLGATKTVIGSDHVQELLDNLSPQIKKVIYRCPCKITFRFGNHGLLQSDVALVVPIHGFHLKVAIVPGSTPFLLSNTLLRALESIIDTQQKVLFSKKLGMSFPLQLTSKGLFLLDLNDLASVKSSQMPPECIAETNVVVEPKPAVPKSAHSNSVSDQPPKNPDKRNPKIIQEESSKEIQGKEDDTWEPSSDHKSDPISLQAQGDTKFARSFQLPVRSSIHDAGQPSSENPSSGGGSSARPQQDVHGPTGEREDHLWNGPQGPHLSRSLGLRSTVDHVVHQPLRKVQEGLSSSVSGLCGVDGGTCRAHSGDRACDRAQQEPSSRSTSFQLVGNWETISEKSPKGSHPNPRLGGDRVRDSESVRHGGVPRRTSECQHRAPRSQDAQPRECLVSSDSPLGDHGKSSRGSQVESTTVTEDQLLLGAGEIGHDHSTEDNNPERCYEGKVFRKLLLQYSQEYEDSCFALGNQNQRSSAKLFEVFCGPSSQLSHQCQRLGFKAVRFGTEQCDLQTFEGRRFLFEQVLSQQPQHLWFSPTCGPWSAWSRLNETKSVALWDKIRHQRIEGLEQIALGTILLRHQRERGKHFHWEQPKSSLMFRLPYLTEVFYHLLNVDIDLCVAGELKDPESGKLIKKALTILTTSPELVRNLQGLRCPGNHDHQPIEGSVLYEGANINRSKFSEIYPRKFARRVAQCLCKVQSPQEKPHQAKDLALAGTDEPSAKRSKTSRATPKVVRVSESTVEENPKRIRLTGKTRPVQASQEWKTVFDKVNELAPRVGKISIEDTSILQTLQQLLPRPGKDLRQVIACRGASRTIAPPADLIKGEAPWRINAFIDRETGNTMIDEEWENWERLSKRQLVRPYHACRLIITAFARNPVESAVPSSESPSVPSTQDPNPKENPTGESDLKKSQVADVENVQQPESFRLLPRDEQTAIVRAHKNLGHPSPERLSTLLRQQGFRAAIAQAALEFRCSTCEAHAQPKLARPSSIKDELDFNDRISVDGMQWTNKSGKTFHIYHIIDWSTSFHAAIAAPNRTSEAFIESCISMWFSWAGAPGEMLIDAGTEMNSEEFSSFVQGHNIKVVTISTEAHHQNGKAERHGAVLQQMLSKIEEDHPILNYQDLKRVLWSCIQAKNACSLKRGYAPEVLVLGKHTRVPGAVSSDLLLPAHLLAESETGQGVLFKQQLALRESARKAFHSADNDAAIRRSILRRSRPGNRHYVPGEWVMIWKQNNGALPSRWIGPMRIVVHENHQTVWTTMLSKLYRVAPEHVRPVTASEARDIRIDVNMTPISTIAQQLNDISNRGQAFDLTTSQPTGEIPTAIPPQNTSHSQEHTAPNTDPNDVAPSSGNSQPDQEPEIPSGTVSEGLPDQQSTGPGEPTSGIDVPIPDTVDEDDLICEGLHCLDIEDNHWQGDLPESAWRCEITLNSEDILSWKNEEVAEEYLFVATAARRQKAEVKFHQLTNEEKVLFQKAKESEVQNWLKTGTVSRILRDKIPYDQILRCRWILTWKPLDNDEVTSTKQTHKAKARLVILGYLDPKIDEIPRDSPTLGRHSKMLLLQMISSQGWVLTSFDIKAAFLQGKPQTDRVLAIEPVEELSKALSLQSNEVCKLEKGAYGLIDAPYQWYAAIKEEMLRLGFVISPFDPCVFILRNPNCGIPDGVIGLHVDDGICGGNEAFREKLTQLEKKYPFGSKKVQNFTFTGIQMSQRGDHSIMMSQEKYVKAIPSITISHDRRKNEGDSVTESERQDLRGLIGSLQYAAVHTRPDLSARLSFLQSDINSAKVSTLMMANQALHEAKRHSEVSIIIQPIPVEELRFLAFSDASFASPKVPNSHSGNIIMATHRNISHNVSCPVSPLSWGCKKIQRVVTSTLAAETASLGTTLDHLSWMKLCWAWMRDPRVKWKSPAEALKQLPESYSTATYKGEPSIPESVAATDCKSLYDLVTRTAPPSCSEFRTQLNARMIKDLLSEGITLRWVHSGAQLADCLTKIMEASFLRETLRIGRYRLNDEQSVLKNRSNARNRLRWLRTSCPSAEEPSWESNDECPI